MTTAQEISARASGLLQPVSDAAPAGQNSAYEPQFESLRAEVGKLDSPTGGQVDWEQVATGGQQILQTLSKDLLVASYTTYAMFEVEKLPGLAVGLDVINGLFDRYWEDCFPPHKRMRARTNALDWLVRRLEIALPQVAVTPPDRAALDLVTAGYQKLADVAREKMDDAAPGMGGVRDVLARLDMKIPKAVAEAAAPAAPADAPATAPPASAPAAESAPPSPTPPPPAPSAAPAPAPVPAAPAPAEIPAAPPAEDALAKLEAQAARWLAPIPGDNPIGEDARYDPLFEQARLEVAKLESARGEVVNWEAVGEAADEVLRTKSKDVLMAAYLAHAKFEAGGVAGLSLGLSIVGGLMDTFPERWPSRTRGQGNALAWLVGQLEHPLGQLKPTPADRDDVELLSKVIKKAAASMRAGLEDNAPSTRPLEEKVQRILLSIPKPQPKEAPKPAPAPTPTPSAAPSAPAPAPRPASPTAPMPTTTADVGSAEEVGKFLAESGRSMVKAAGILRRAQPSSPAAYRLLRVGLYLHLDAPPPAGAGGKTQIPALPEARRKPLELMAANDKWAALIEETESTLATFRFFLDLHYLSAKALRGLGPDYAAAHEALLAELGALLRRMPGLPDLCASDGSPLASDETRSWIDSDVVATGGGGGAAGPSTDDPGEDLKKARTLLAANKAGEGLAIAKESIASAGHPRLKFVRRLALADACLGADQAQLARAMFGALDQELRDEGLTRWEPDLAGRCLEGLVRAIRATIKKGAKDDGSGQAAFERLAAVDPVRAAKLATG
jgi:type VI secretion system protein VasJ